MYFFSVVWDADYLISLSTLTSYRKLSLKYHPEKNKSPGTSQKFDELAEAYDVLSNCKSQEQAFNNNIVFRI